MMQNIHKTKIQQISKFKLTESTDHLERRMLRAYYDNDLKDIRDRIQTQIPDPVRLLKEIQNSCKYDDIADTIETLITYIHTDQSGRAQAQIALRQVLLYARGNHIFRNDDIRVSTQNDSLFLYRSLKKYESLIYFLESSLISSKSNDTDMIFDMVRLMV